MQAIEIKQPGGPEVLVPTQRPEPVAKAGEVLVRVTASGVNRPDVMHARATTHAAWRLRSAGPGSGGHAGGRRRLRTGPGRHEMGDQVAPW